MRRLYFFSICLVLYELAAYLANDMIMPGMIQVIHTFNASQGYVALSLGYYLLGNCVFMLIAGALSEHYGKRQIMLIGNSLFLLFTVLIIFSQNIYQFMLLRFLEGSGLSIIAIGYALIHENFNDKNAVKLISLMGIVSLLAPLIGPVFGSLIISFLSWHYIFIVTAIMSIISLIGLYKYTPSHSQPIEPVAILSHIKKYQHILRNKQFLQGALCIVLTTMPILFWIGQAPNLVLYKLQQNYTHFVIYQIISVGGMIVASILMQFIAGKYSMHSIIKTGTLLLLSGLLISVLGYSNIYIVVSGFSIYTLGVGLANGCLFRLVMSIKDLPSALLSTMLGFIQTLFFVIGIIISNRIFHYFDYSLLSFTLACFACALLAFWMIRRYIPAFHQREWE